MTPQQLEALVLRAMDRLRNGNQLEDDRIELKREWPDPATKARQLAASANRANGEPLIYIVGVDERDGRVHPTANFDPADWTAQIAARFDEIAPDLRTHINVPLGEGESVVALLFATDRAPYLIKAVGGGSPEREVPIRDGTRTRSARRDELLRLLVPQTQVPPATVLSAAMRGTWYAANDMRGMSTVLSGEATIFLEHTASTSIFLPVHQSEAVVRSATSTLHLGISYWSHGKDDPPLPVFGVHTRVDGVVATGPGTFTCRLNYSTGEDLREEFLNTANWRLALSFGVAGASRNVSLDLELQRGGSRMRVTNDVMKDLGTWEFTPPAVDRLTDSSST